MDSVKNGQVLFEDVPFSINDNRGMFSLGMRVVSEFI